jgi:hypothetical protein
MSDKKKDSNEEELGMSPLREAALQMHEMYSELVRAGFTRRQSVTIVAHIMATGVHEGMEEYGHIDDSDQGENGNDPY